MKNFIHIFLIGIALAFVACNDELTFRVFHFDDSQTKADNITSTGATLSCELVDDEEGEFSKWNPVEFVYSMDPGYFENGSGKSWDVYAKNSAGNEGNAAGKYTAVLTKLEPGKTYYYRARVGNVIYSGVHQFTTLGPKSITVVTDDATNITISSAKLSGSCTLNNGAKLAESGILLHTSSIITYTSYKKKYSSSLTNFSADATDLSSNTTYYFCAYAKDTDGNLYYGAVKSFSTQMYKAALSEFIGTYNVKFDFATASPGYSQPNRTWTYNQTGTLVVKQITKPAGASGTWVTMILKSSSNYDYCQMNGIYDPATYTIELFGDVAGANMTPVAGSNYSWSLCANCGVWSGSNMGTANMPCYSYGTTGYLLSNGTGYQGTVPMRLSKSSATAMVVLSAVSADLTYKYTPNGIGHYWGFASDKKFSSLIDIDEFLNITFTSKTSNTPQDLGVGNSTLYNPG